jgi:hypothetical protein
VRRGSAELWPSRRFGQRGANPIKIRDDKNRHMKIVGIAQGDRRFGTLSTSLETVQVASGGRTDCLIGRTPSGSSRADMNGGR